MSIAETVHGNDEQDFICEVERQLLSILLLHPHKVTEVADMLDADMFTSDLHRVIYGEISSGARAGRTVDRITIRAVLTSKEQLVYVGIMLADSIGSTLQLRDYARAVRDNHHRREISAIFASGLSDVEKVDAAALVRREMDTTCGGDVASLSSIMDEAYDGIDAAHRRGGGLSGLSTGLKDLDNILCGLEAGGLYVLAGRPAMGKTACAMTIAMNAATKGNPVLFFSLEMSSKQLAHRINARYARVPIHAQKNGGQASDFIRLEKTRNDMAKVPLSVIDKSELTAEQIVAKAKEISKLTKQSLIVIDHLGIVDERDKSKPRVYQVGEMTRTFKGLAKDLDVPVLLLHQLNRGVEGRDDKRPSMADLRNSGSVEQDADAVLLLYRREYYLRKREPENSADYQKWIDELRACEGAAEIIIDKNRQGETGLARLRFHGEEQFFETWEARQ